MKKIANSEIFNYSFVYNFCNYFDSFIKIKLCEMDETIKLIIKIINNRKIKKPEICGLFQIAIRSSFTRQSNYQKTERIEKEYCKHNGSFRNSIWDFRVKKNIVRTLEALGIEANLSFISKFHVLVKISNLLHYKIFIKEFH